MSISLHKTTLMDLTDGLDDEISSYLQIAVKDTDKIENIAWKFCSRHDVLHALHIMIHFSPTIFHFFTTKITFAPDPFFTPPISVTSALTKTLTYPSTLGGHTRNAAVPSPARFMTYLDFECHVGVWGKWAFCWENSATPKWKRLRMIEK